MNKNWFWIGATTAWLSMGACAQNKAVTKDSSNGQVPALEQPEVFSENPVYFSYDDASLTEAGRDSLNTVAKWLKAHPEEGLIVQGHADWEGSPDYNYELGLRRAEEVKNHLVSCGIDTDRLFVQSAGESQPVNDVKWKNRRTVFMTTDPGADTAHDHSQGVIQGASTVPEEKSSLQNDGS